MFKILMKKNKTKNTSAVNSAADVTHRHPSTQSWLMVKDIHDQFVVRKDDVFVSAVKIAPVNINLLSKNEQRAKIKALHEVLNGIREPFQILSIYRPVDLDGYIMKLKTMRDQTTNRIKSRILSETMRHAAATATSGKAVERQFYLLLSSEKGKNEAMEKQNLFRKIHEIAGRLTNAGLESYVCQEQDLRELLFIFFSQEQAAYERAPLTNLEFPTIYEAEGN